MATDILLREFNTLPENLQAQVVDFILFLKKSNPLASQRRKPARRKSLKAGFGKYKITMRPDFEEPLEAFKEYLP